MSPAGGGGLPCLRAPLAVAVAVLLVATAVAPTPSADVEAGRRKAQACGRCHGPDGNAIVPGTPSLAGQPAWFTHWALIKFRDGRRRDPQMSPFAAGLGDADMADLAAYYAAMPPRRRPYPVDAARVEEGRRLATAHRCTSCHGPDLGGRNQVPRLAGQDLEYLRRMLRAYRAQTAGDLEGLMTMAAQALGDDEIEALAHYMNALPAP